jgi:hypothetical protein
MVLLLMGGYYEKAVIDSSHPIPDCRIRMGAGC